ncbi:MAG: VCBS repeat-containing protein [Acidobacteriia bacterium]|nr:VCBS repeat-containing protein [Terriglobia bacterium]
MDWKRCVWALAATWALGAQAQPRADIADRLARHRNLGKAFFENPTTQAQSVNEFKQALDLAPQSARERLNYGLALLAAGRTPEGIAEIEKVQKQDPKIPHTWFNLGIQYKKAGDYPKARQQLETMLRLAPNEPVSHYNLGALLKLEGDNQKAAEQFEIASKLDPNLAAPHFQLFNLHRQLGRKEDSARRLQLFQQIKKQQEGAASAEDMEWSYYSEILDSVEPAIQHGPALRPVKFLGKRLAPPAGSAVHAGVAIGDFDANGTPDLAAWSGGRLRLFRNGSIAWADPAVAALPGVVFAAPGDFNNDGFPDLLVLTSKGVTLLQNQKGRFARHPITAPVGIYQMAVWLDYDHDYDLDLILLGESSALLRNQGTAGFAGRSQDFPFVKATATGAASFRLIPDTKGMDLAVAYQGRAGVLYHDQLGGKFEAQPLPGLPPGATSIVPADADHNSTVDLFYESGGKTELLLNTSTGITAGQLRPAGLGAAAGAFAIDASLRGVLDLAAGGTIHANAGGGRYGSPQTAAGLAAAVTWASADFNADGLPELASVYADGAVQLYTNQTATKNAWIRVALNGVKNPKLALGSEVEVKAGRSYQKKIYQGFPLLFGLGSYREADAVRITWPNGLIQHEARQPAYRQHTYKEAQRLSGSCPQVWTWNGTEFEYISDVLGVGPLGAASGDGSYFPVDHLEHIQISGSQLRPRNGAFEIRLTEELSEVAYIDQIRLIAVDHPAMVAVHTNEKFQAPPYPDLQIYSSTRPLFPVAARDSDGAEVRAQLLAQDGIYADRFRRTEAGIAEPHTLELDFGAELATSHRTLLILHGWVDWADGSSFLGYAQQDKRGLLPPSLAVQNVKGEWRTIFEDMGMPAGKPKTIAVDLAGKLLPGDRRLRISSNMALYWDQIYLAMDAHARPRTTTLSPNHAALDFRGFSRVLVDPERKQPEMFYYPGPLAVSMWNPTPGFYTKYGDVLPLMKASDDQMVIMGSGDELTLRFPAEALPALPVGMQRSYILAVDGWAKDRDANTAFSQSVEPLPFHGMSSYPYPSGEVFPDSESHRNWRTQYNTRPALRLIRPLQGNE